MKSCASNADGGNGSHRRTRKHFAHFTVYVSVLYQLAYANVKMTSYIDGVPITGFVGLRYCRGVQGACQDLDVELIQRSILHL
jgi:hypothetical protein